jgi:hypothetical protein
VLVKPVLAAFVETVGIASSSQTNDAIFVVDSFNNSVVDENGNNVIVIE